MCAQIDVSDPGRAPVSMKGILKFTCRIPACGQTTTVPYVADASGRMLVSWAGDGWVPFQASACAICCMASGAFCPKHDGGAQDPANLLPCKGHRK